jgi:hypothetical protein
LAEIHRKVGVLLFDAEGQLGPSGCCCCFIGRVADDAWSFDGLPRTSPILTSVSLQPLGRPDGECWPSKPRLQGHYVQARLFTADLGSGSAPRGRLGRRSLLHRPKPPNLALPLGLAQGPIFGIGQGRRCWWGVSRIAVFGGEADDDQEGCERFLHSIESDQAGRVGWANVQHRIVCSRRVGKATVPSARRPISCTHFMARRPQLQVYPSIHPSIYLPVSYLSACLSLCPSWSLSSPPFILRLLATLSTHGCVLHVPFLYHFCST